MTLDSATLTRLARSVLVDMLRIPLQEAAPHHGESHDSRPAWEGAIRIAGDCEAELRLLVDDSLAVRICEVFFDRTAGDLDDLDIRDAVGELVNIIGGNLKGLFNGESQLSLPSSMYQRTRPPTLAGAVHAALFTACGTLSVEAVVHRPSAAVKPTSRMKDEDNALESIQP